ncbi:hypothetical protein [Prosthecomicrobium hirschii]|uniref:DUF7736 domain-containing protein n=1 Tax=Prosthecodimorpha hirschii TaxID=665126 RepID=UPI00221FCC83|nr:hypothetical protein [Prosthecomicrobium hirschii]MCW1844184.1 hypothetical protein [Prosthecomicrobium hirschii]
MQDDEFDPVDLASVTTSVLLQAPFSRAHRAFEHALGHPVWTHEIKRLQPAASRAILDQFPNMPTSVDGDYVACAAAVRARYGDMVRLAKGPGVRDKDPMTTLTEALS